MFAYMLWHALTDIFSLSKCSQWCWALVLFQPDGFTSCFRPQESEGGTAQWNESCVALIWTGSQDFTRLLLEESGRIWKNLEESGRIWKNLEESGRIWKNLEESGRIWKNLEESGRWSGVDVFWYQPKWWACTGFDWQNRMEPDGTAWYEMMCLDSCQVSLMRRTRRSLTVKWVQWAIAGDFVTLVGVGKKSVTGVARCCKCIPGFWRWLDISGLIHTRYLARAMDYPIDEGSYPLPFQPVPVQLRSHRRQMRWAARKFHGKSPASCSRQSLFVISLWWTETCGTAPQLLGLQMFTAIFPLWFCQFCTLSGFGTVGLLVCLYDFICSMDE